MNRPFARRLRESPEGRLTAHFFSAMFDFGILTPEGSDSFTHLLLGLIGALLALGLGLVRVYAAKYAFLSAQTSPAPYRLAVLGDDLFLIGLPMLLVALITLLVSQQLFPDERDFRILGPLPIRRIVIFRAKLAAVFLFTGLCAAVLQLMLAPLALLSSFSRFSEYSVLSRFAAWMIASVTASVFAILAVAAGVGVMMIALSRTRVHSFIAITRSTLLALLVVLIPLAFRLAGAGASMARETTWMMVVPSAWFVGLQRVLLGTTTPWFLQLAGMAIVASAVAALAVAGIYVLLFQRFEQLLLRPPSIRPKWWRRKQDPYDPSPVETGRRASEGASQAFRAVYRFTTTTLRRSQLHQGVLFALSACGVSLVTTRLVGANLLVRGPAHPSTQNLLAYLSAWTPFALMFVCGISARAALALPLSHRANWIFRVTENQATRDEQMRAVERVVAIYTVGLPIVAGFPLLLLMNGPSDAIAAIVVVGLVGAVFIHAVLVDWRRIPFTCSYLPGKRLVVYTVVPGFAAFALFTPVGAHLVQVAIRTTSAALGIAVVLALVAIGLRRKRIAQWRETPLMFDDELPDQPVQLGL